jgi:arsenite-transporting ATPase
MRTVRVYEPALCCNTGVCGPDVDEGLVTFTADLHHLKGLGADIERHNLANDPGAFVASDPVRSYLELVGSGGLPMTVVDGVTVMTGGYPTRAQLLAYTGLASPVTAPEGATQLGVVEESTSSCCSGGGCC